MLFWNQKLHWAFVFVEMLQLVVILYPIQSFWRLEFDRFLAELGLWFVSTIFVCAFRSRRFRCFIIFITWRVGSSNRDFFYIRFFRRQSDAIESDNCTERNSFFYLTSESCVSTRASFLSSAWPCACFGNESMSIVKWKLFTQQNNN